MSTLLKFINRSTAAENMNLIVSQRNVADVHDEQLVAWHVICRPKIDVSHPINIPKRMELASSDMWGTYLPRIPADPGMMYEVVLDPSGHRLRRCGHGPSPTEVAVLNSLPRGQVNFSIYKEGKLLAAHHNRPPQTRAHFAFEHTIWIGLLPEVIQGEALSQTAMNSPSAEMSLLDVRSANIIVTGGGSMPFQFQMTNVEREQ